MFNVLFINICFQFVDRDRLRTTSSVISHCSCAAAVWSLCKKDLKHIDEHYQHIPRNETKVTIMDDVLDEIKVENGNIVNRLDKQSNLEDSYDSDTLTTTSSTS